MKSLLFQCCIAALVAAGTSAALSKSQQEPERNSVAAQIAALGFDLAEVKASLAGLSREDRIDYLRALGVQLNMPERP